jgi:hypothetical protein
MLRAFFLIFTILAAHSAYATDTQLNSYFGFSTSRALQKWDETPQDFSQGDITNSFGSISLGTILSRKGYEFHIDSKLTYVNSDYWLGYLLIGAEDDVFIPNLRGGFKAEFLSTNLTNGQKYKDSMFDYFLYGLNTYLKYQHRNHQFFFDFKMRTTTDSEISTHESTTTKVRHEWDNISTLGVTSQIKDFIILAQIKRFKFSKTKILSKEFSYIIEDTNLNQYGLGLAYTYKRYTLWIRTYQFNSPDDEVSHFFQAPYFAPDYTLAKKTIEVELLWKF